MTKKDAVDSIILMFFRPPDFPWYYEFLTGLQQDKKLAPPLAGVFSMTGQIFTAHMQF